MPTDVPRPLFRRLLRWALWTAASLFLIGVLGFAYVTFVGITVDASLLRGRIATVFSDALGRTVRWYMDNQPWWRAIKERSAEFKAYYEKQYANR